MSETKLTVAALDLLEAKAKQCQNNSLPVRLDPYVVLSLIAAARERKRISELELERDAYKRAKEENDDRFMRERDEARERAAKLEAEKAQAWDDGYAAGVDLAPPENPYRRPKGPTK